MSIIIQFIILTINAIQKWHVCESNCDNGARSTNGQNVIVIRDQDEFGPRLQSIDWTVFSHWTENFKKS